MLISANEHSWVGTAHSTEQHCIPNNLAFSEDSQAHNTAHDTPSPTANPLSQINADYFLKVNKYRYLFMGIGWMLIRKN